MITLPTNKIPKIIHYCRFWGNSKSQEFEKYLKSRKKYNPDFEIHERNESNYDVRKNKYSDKLYKEKKRAFLVDYVRCDILYKYGGIYLDTDIQSIKSFDWLLENDCFVWFESKKSVNGAVWWSVAGHSFLHEMLDYYERRKLLSFPTSILPHIMTHILRKHWLLLQGKEQTVAWVHVYPSSYFYPLAYYETLYYKTHDVQELIPSSSYTIHRNDAHRLPLFIKVFWFKLLLFINKGIL